MTRLWSGRVGLQLYVETHGQRTNHHEADMLWGSANRPLSTAKLQGPGFEKKERFALLVEFYTSLQTQFNNPSHLY